MQAAKTKSSFDGFIYELPDVAVDNFKTLNCKAYFLSHCHSDHTQGLFSEAFLQYLKRSQVYIYMSEASASIVEHESVNKDIAQYIWPLKVGELTTIIIPGDEYERTEEWYLTISPIPASHCFGSVMFLFTTVYKTVLYTGDFRIDIDSIKKYSQLHNNGDIIKIDVLYVDTTFKNDCHDEFPKRSESVAVLIPHIQEWLGESETNRVALHTSASYGYEFVFNQIFKCIGEKVYVDEKKWELYRKFPTLVPGVTNQNAKIHLCKNRTEAQTHEKCSPTLKYEQFLYIHFSAYKWTEYREDDSMIEILNKKGKYRIDVCFATHCSKSELEFFVNYLNPPRVVGFPNEYVREIPYSSDDSGDTDEESTPEPRMLDKETVIAMFAD